MLSSLLDELDEMLEARIARSAPLRMLFFDIETAPLLAHVWSAKTHFIGAHQFQHDSFLLCWAAKWGDGRKVHDDVLTAEEARAQDDRRVIVSLALLLREADIVVAHNGDRFDVPMLNNRLLALGEEPLGPVKTIDTLKLAKSSFRLASNKLDYLAQHLGVGSKIKADFDLWLDCYHGNVKALKQMVRYNRQDVRVLESVYHAITPYVKGLPRLVDGTGRSPAVCPSCGSLEMEPAKPYRTNASTFPAWRCLDCGRYARSRKSDPTKKLDLHPL